MRADAVRQRHRRKDVPFHARPRSWGRPGADAFEDGAERDAPVHIRIQMRNGRKSITSVTGLADDLDLKKILKAFKRNFKCNGAIIQVRFGPTTPLPASHHLLTQTRGRARPGRTGQGAWPRCPAAGRPACPGPRLPDRPRNRAEGRHHCPRVLDPPPPTPCGPFSPHAAPPWGARRTRRPKGPAVPGLHPPSVFAAPPCHRARRRRAGYSAKWGTIFFTCSSM